jgi:hypothetical protein
MNHDNVDSLAFYKAEEALKNYLKKEKPRQRKNRIMSRKHQKVEARARNGKRKR